MSRHKAIDAAVIPQARAGIQRRRGQKLGNTHACLMADLGPGARLSELARRLGVTRTAIGPLVAALEGEGLIERVADPTDRRAHIVRPTTLAGDLFRVGTQQMDKIEAKGLTALGPHRLRELAFCLGLFELWREGG